MKSGTLNRRVTIQAPAAGQDANGDPVTGFTDVATVWASVDDISGREFLSATAGQNKVNTKIGIRYRPGILPSMRVVYGLDNYNIEAVLGQDKRSLLLMCSRLS